MDTLSHGIWSFFLFRNTKWNKSLIVGSLIPDAGFWFCSLFFLPALGSSSFVQWLQSVYSVPIVYTIDSCFHSLVIWLCALGIALCLGIRNLGIWIGVFLHILTDLFTHRYMLAAYLYPLSEAKIAGPLDYLSLAFLIADWSGITIAVMWMILRRLNRPE